MEHVQPTGGGASASGGNRSRAGNDAPATGGNGSPSSGDGLISASNRLPSNGDGPSTESNAPAATAADNDPHRRDTLGKIQHHARAV